jgi:resuscitation-promoting factor RpfB
MEALNRFRLALLVGLLIAAPACGVAQREADIAEAPPTTEVARATTSLPPTTPPPTVDSGLVGDCVSYVQFGAFTGNPLLAAIWNEAGQDVGRLRTICDEIGRTNASTLEGMSKQWTDIETFIAVTQTSAAPEPPRPLSTQPEQVTTLPPPPPTTHPQPPPPPPTVAAVASGCDDNYTGACVPIASDVDCAGGSGNGPAYVNGPVYVVGVDIYGLDGNNDGVGCE